MPSKQQEEQLKAFGLEDLFALIQWLSKLLERLRASGPATAGDPRVQCAMTCCQHALAIVNECCAAMCCTDDVVGAACTDGNVVQDQPTEPPTDQPAAQPQGKASRRPLRPWEQAQQGGKTSV